MKLPSAVIVCYSKGKNFFSDLSRAIVLLSISRLSGIRISELLTGLTSVDILLGLL